MSSDKPDPVAGVDVGGTGVRVRVVHGERSAERRRAVVLPRKHGRVDVPALCTLVLNELRPAMAGLGLTELAGLGLGMTGMPGLVENSRDVDHHLRPPLGLGALALAGDSVTTHLGALAGAPGTVVAAGTGVIALATDFEDVWHQVDGWGVLLGDEGSGAWIGRRGLQAALRSIDGRTGGSAALANRLQQRFGTPLELIDRTYSSPSPAYELASFAPDVAAAARSGDPVAESLLTRAGKLLGQAAVAGSARVPARISWGGGLFRAGDLLLDPFRREVLRAMPAAELIPPAGSAVDGAVLLAREAIAGRAGSRAPHLVVFDAPPAPAGAR